MVDLLRYLSTAVSSDLATVVVSLQYFESYLFPWPGVLGFPSHDFGHSSCLHLCRLARDSEPLVVDSQVVLVP